MAMFITGRPNADWGSSSASHKNGTAQKLFLHFAAYLATGDLVPIKLLSKIVSTPESAAESTRSRLGSESAARWFWAEAPQHPQANIVPRIPQARSAQHSHDLLPAWQSFPGPDYACRRGACRIG